ncbi:BTAD domain-containing putative transcriptional regulator [Defluviimonas sp. SAOS-178_SWC]|uniref:BTAD domain-containing putative transcriptional regulator n=1 Tax=Defluviimonas sp. SAOS-178_SWC TaxID=3121287 RepID=UPI0032214A4F
MPRNLRLTLLGPFRFGTDHSEIPISAAKQKALLALLALAPEGRLPNERIMALLWGDRADPQARDSLKHALADLRTRLGDTGTQLLNSQHGTVDLDLGQIAVDARELADLLASGTAEALRRAVAQPAGELLDGLSIRDAAFEDWLRDEREAWHERRRTAGRRLLTLMRERNDDTGTLDAAKILLDLDPLSADAVRAVMHGLAEGGDKIAALRCFATYADRLRADLDVAPDADTAALAETLRSRPELPSGHDARRTSRPVSTKPSIAVLPFRNLNGKTDEDYFAEGIAEDIVTALSQYRWFFVIARNSSFLYRDRRDDLRGIAAELGVRYILDGSVRRSGSSVRITGELVEPETGIQVWGGRYDRDISDIFALQEEIARRVVGAIEPEILRGESQRAAAKPSVNLDAYDCHMRGVWYHNRQNMAEDFDKSIEWQKKAVDLDPMLARASMIMSRSIYARALHGFSQDLDQDRRDLLEAATHAVSLEDRDSYAHYAMCLAHLMDQQPAAAVLEAERATELAVNFALGQNALGWSRVFTGKFAEAIPPIETAMRLSPVDPVGYFFHAAIGLAHYHLGHYEEAARHAQRGYSSKPRYFNMLVLLAALGQLNRRAETTALAAQARTSRPKDHARYWQLLFPYADNAHRDHFREGMARAGYAPDSEA